jgi:hypothetical protein
MKRGGGLFCFGDVVPVGYFTEAEIADLEARGKITVEREQVIELEPVAEVIELEAPKADKKHSAKHGRKR